MAMATRIASTATPPGQSPSLLDLALVLAVDCSSSVDAGDYKLQMQGIAAALRNPALYEAIASGTYGRIALALVHWSTSNSQSLAIGWSSIASRADLESTARQAENAERKWQAGGTGLAAALAFSTALLQSLPAAAARRVIDVSGDGEENDGGDVGAARQAALAQGITINGLPIVSGSPSLEVYYRQVVIGGPGAFIVPAGNLAAFAKAMAQKLLREVSERPTS
jgi:hypothetical protein